MDAISLHVLLIALLAVVQSLFGMGILVFGTPTLLLLGVDFTAVLGLLLPSSVLISSIQVVAGRQQPWSGRDLRNMALCAAIILVALSVLIRLNWKAQIDVWIGLTMLAAAALRYWRPLQRRLRQVLGRWQAGYVALMGTLHGLTNMGGALLALYASNLHQDKLAIRTTIARYYLLFGLIQLTTLALLRPAALSWQGLAVAPVAALAYLVAGNLLFKRASTSFYERGITVFIAIYGVAVLLKAQF
ncbi:TSUP family transporter [Jeongeupia chitinilytica]|uniref:Probable membrane transporter protein n=1 Tax=Jeongeupia chitinilytica TaxID=1041641 RepID=A0ABQ3GY87_9NEIS|nr:TSUP family transporter [Jeongeupia chitinilytica]GHD59441.1 hypothetical protein GCM10007350_10920 [Jeongeupia chitinilytica]